MAITEVHPLMKFRDKDANITAIYPKVSATDLIDTVSVEKGGTGGTTAADARANLEAVKMTTTQIVIQVSDWVEANKAAGITVSGVTANNTVIVTPFHSNNSFDAYTECEIRCIGQTTDKLTFKCSEIPTVAVNVVVIILE